MQTSDSSADPHGGAERRRRTGGASGSSYPSSRQLSLFPLTATLLAVALILGGAGDGYPSLAAAVEAAGLLLIWRLGVTGRLWRPPSGARAAAVLALLIAALPFIQLVPLPFAIWAELPGRALAVDVLRAAGVPHATRPLSLDADLTLSAALALLPGLGLFLAALQLRTSERIALITIVGAIALASALLGGLQRAAGTETLFLPYTSDHNAYAPGLFVNRNHQAAFLNAAMPLVAALAWLDPRAQQLPPLERNASFTAAIALLAGGVVATTSRMGLALLVPAILASCELLYRPKWTTGRVARIALLAIPIAFAAYHNSAVDLVLSRFTQPEEGRYSYWTDSEVAIVRYWPFGSGYGTFPRVFPTVENLDTMAQAFAPHAHNDYLELALEGGAGAVLAMVLVGLFLLSRLVLLTRSRERRQRSLGFAASAALAIMMMHSIVDYPLRMLGLSGLFGLLCAVLVMSARTPDATAIEYRSRDLVA